VTPLYLDTGAMAKLYLLEPGSEHTARLLAAYRPPFPFSHWQEIEIRTALRLKVFRGEMSGRESQESLRHLRTDIGSGVWQRPVYDPADVFHEAERLSARHAATLGCRTLDVLHVAAAVVLNATDFLTYDVRQANLARKAGLRVIA